MIRSQMILVLIGTVFSVLSILGLEMACGFLLTSSQALGLGASVLSLQRDYYVGVDQNLMSYNSACAEYDKELTYRLKPPGCQFDNREYSTRVHVNSAGLRDTESSLSGPSIIFLGDSVTAGWGVEEPERYSNIISQVTGKKVLNAGVPSYATGREFQLLKTLDASQAEAIVLQYSENDSGENSEYAGRRFVLSPMSETDYQKASSLLTVRRQYHFGKYMGSLYGVLTDRSKYRWSFKSPELTEEAEFNNFVEILCHHAGEFSGKKLIIFSVARKGYYRASFSQEVRNRIGNHPECFAHSEIHVLDVDERLDDKDFYVIDDHPSTVGHQRIAEALIPRLERSRPHFAQTFSVE